MSLYADKKMKEDKLSLIHPQLHKVVKKIFISYSNTGDINEFLI